MLIDISDVFDVIVLIILFAIVLMKVWRCMLLNVQFGVLYTFKYIEKTFMVHKQIFQRCKGYDVMASRSPIGSLGLERHWNITKCSALLLLIHSIRISIMKNIKLWGFCQCYLWYLWYFCILCQHNRHGSDHQTVKHQSVSPFKQNNSTPGSSY